ncbi:hypothetical protein MIR68_007014 [Amoeboaphelidium protococcarum]|nr:hypothetical protein MIR68_007014 [Amoeboaphelidium protococcarum]
MPPKRKRQINVVKAKIIPKASEALVDKVKACFESQDIDPELYDAQKITDIISGSFTDATAESETAVFNRLAENQLFECAQVNRQDQHMDSWITQQIYLCMLAKV